MVTNINGTLDTNKNHHIWQRLQIYFDILEGNLETNGEQPEELKSIAQILQAVVDDDQKKKNLAENS